MQRLLGNLAYFQQFSIILSSISILVTFLLVSVVLVIGVNEKRGEIAAMRSIGFRNHTLRSIVIMESVILIGISSVIGVVAGIPLARYLNDLLVASPGIPDTFDFFVANPRAIAAALLIAVTTGLVAALYPAVHTTRVDIVRTMHEEIL
jgi:ABC-type antimicrobial peptide transport system permease subunit